MLDKISLKMGMIVQQSNFRMKNPLPILDSILAKQLIMCLCLLIKLLLSFNHPGFYHEQSRPDRDQYINIIWDNILPDKQDQFKKYDPKTEAHHLGAPYDTCSVMHYLDNAFSKVNQLPYCS